MFLVFMLYFAADYALIYRIIGLVLYILHFVFFFLTFIINPGLPDVSCSLKPYLSKDYGPDNRFQRCVYVIETCTV